MALSVKTKEHIRRRAAVLGPKWGALLGGAAALALAIGFTGTALRFVTVADSHGGTTRILTASTELEDVLQKAETPALGENDEAVWTETADGERLDILRAYTVSITADGSEQTMTLTGSHTAAELLAAAGVAYTADDILTPGAEEIVPEGSNVTLQRVSYVEYTVNETVPSAVESLPTSLLYRKQDKADRAGGQRRSGHGQLPRDVGGRPVGLHRGAEPRHADWYDSHRAEGLWRAGSCLVFCRAGDCGRCARRGCGRSVHEPALHRVFGVGHGQGGQRPPFDLRHRGGQPQHHPLWLTDVH